MSKILVIQGPNLNLLGKREPEIYGKETLNDIHANLKQLASFHELEIDFFQANGEHLLIERVHQAKVEGVQIILLNAAAFTHTSIALRDALLGVNIPFIEVHLSNIYAREPFRKRSYFADKAIGTICGFGAKSYELAFYAAVSYLGKLQET
jgi:3-dehydroquinate dehydratase II